MKQHALREERDGEEIEGDQGTTVRGTSTLDLALRLVEHLAHAQAPVSLGALAVALGASKATLYRHLVTLVRQGFARQDPETGRYDVGIKLLVLGEASKNRFGVSSAARERLMQLRDETRLAVTICSVIDDDLVVLDLIQGQTVIEFGTRPGTRLDFHASAHGKVWLAFGPPRLLERTLAGPLKAWTPHTITDPAILRQEVDLVRRRGFASAPDQVVTAVNTIATPVFDYRGLLVGSLAIVGFTQFIPADPPPELTGRVVSTARAMSQALGWKG